jgi:hypothetical protein
VKTNIQELIDNYKQAAAHRTDHTKTPYGAPQLSTASVTFELATKTQAISHGGVALIHQVAIQSGLIDALNSVPVFKRRLPYYESDHILNIAYNIFCGGTALEHIEYRRNDPIYLNMLGTHSIPDPTTAGDFCRRYDATTIDLLQDYINKVRLKVWKRQSPSFFKEAVVDLDGTIAPTDGECKQGMDISYNGQWGYHPLIVSLANTKEILFIKNRSGNRPSYEDAHLYIDKSIILLRKAGFGTIRFRGDTDYSQTEHLDRWDEAGVFFTFGIKAMANLVEIANNLENTEWERLVRLPKYEVKTVPLGKRENFKEQIVEAREFRNLVLEHEDVAMIDYRPGKCKRSYRLVILRKTITVKKGQKLLLPEIRYFFYITNDCDRSATEIVFESNARCNQENLIAQLKSGMKALHCPLNTLNANWMYMVCVSLSWSLKSWLALSIASDRRDREGIQRRDRLLKMEFPTFLQAMINIPAQILRSGRRTVVRLLSINSWTETFFGLADCLGLARRVQQE